MGRPPVSSVSLDIPKSFYHQRAQGPGGAQMRKTKFAGPPTSTFLPTERSARAAP